MLNAPPEDNARPEDLVPEPEGFWDEIRAQIQAWEDEYGTGD